MPYIPPEVVARAREMDLLTYLRTYEPQELVHFGGSTYCTREHDSLKISNGKWCWFSRGIGGYSALDYLIKVKEMPFTQAVETIMGNLSAAQPAFVPVSKAPKEKVLLLPQANRNTTHAVEYLHRRGIDYPQQGRGKQYGEWRAEQEQRPTWRGLIRTDIDEAIRQAMTERQFFDALQKKGYAMKVGKDISVRPPGKERFMRLMRNFGEDYSLDNIRRRILSQSRLERKKPEQKPEILRVRLIGSLKTARKLTGFRALYVHYCYLLGIFPKNRPQQSRKRMHFLLREDLLKLDAITAETRLLIGHRIDTAEQLFCYRDEVNGKIEALTSDRKQLYKAQRTAAVKSDPEKATEVKAQIAALSKELAALRKEVVLCNSIAERSSVLQEKIKAVREDEHIKEKEKCDRTEQQKAGR